LSLEDAVLTHPRSRELLARIRSSPHAVGVHVRRGDILLPHHRHLQLPAIDRYYEQAFDHLASKVPDAQFFVFSDDPGWCKIAFASRGPRVLHACDFAAGPDSVIADFHLLSQCAHFIIANSAFSWWAAWLGGSEGSIVVTPDRFETANLLDPDELLPSRWVRIAFS
jgi:hypothetical protein